MSDYTTGYTPPPRDQAAPPPNGNPEGWRAEAAPERRAPGSDSVPMLLRRLVDDLGRLVRKELALAASELGASIRSARNGAGAMVSGGAVLYAGLLTLLAAAVLALAQVLPLWASAAVVGGAVVSVGASMIAVGRSRLALMSFTPDRTAESLRKDQDAFRRHSHVGT